MSLLTEPAASVTTLLYYSDNLPQNIIWERLMFLLDYDYHHTTTSQAEWQDCKCLISVSWIAIPALNSATLGAIRAAKKVWWREEV
ncbi:hypothetical protein Golob_005501 [Gossypium lobatum]|uniref:Uncharacterized protein n=1 Tax=Gossypium lobatum TaxID=34289 RepID=A0A7J8MTG1_9ROSI|nr:hypothetical protein [Gossypium lobatum]